MFKLLTNNQKIFNFGIEGEIVAQNQSYDRHIIMQNRIFKYAKSFLRYSNDKISTKKRILSKNPNFNISSIVYLIDLLSAP